MMNDEEKLKKKKIFATKTPRLQGYFNNKTPWCTFVPSHMRAFVAILMTGWWRCGLTNHWSMRP
jgi:hypothetical protein